MTDQPPADRTAAIYDAIDAFQRTHRLPGLQHAQHRGLLAEHMARTLPTVVSPPPATDRATVYAEVADRLAADAEQGEKEGFTRIYRRSAAKQVREWAAELRRMVDEAQQQKPEAGDDLNGALIEDYLRFLRGQGPEPDLSDLPPGRREAITGQFEIVRALADRDPSLPPLDRDPVARRLGLHQAADEAQQQPETRTAEPVRHAPGTAVLCPHCRPMAGQISINGSDGQPLVTIHIDEQHLEYGPGYEPDEAAQAFWDAMKHHMPSPMVRQYGQPLTDTINAELAAGQEAQQALERVRSLADEMLQAQHGVDLEADGIRRAIAERIHAALTPQVKP